MWFRNCVCLGVYTSEFVCVLLKRARSGKIGNWYSQLANPSSAPAQPVWMAMGSAGLGWPLQPSFTGFCAHICVTSSNIYSCTSQTCALPTAFWHLNAWMGGVCLCLSMSDMTPWPLPSPSFIWADLLAAKIKISLKIHVHKGNSFMEKPFSFLLLEPCHVIKSSSHITFSPGSSKGGHTDASVSSRLHCRLPAGCVPWATPPCVLWDVPGPGEWLVFLRLLACSALAGTEPWAVSGGYLPQAVCCWGRGLGTVTFPFNFPCQCEHLMGQPFNHMIFLVRSIPEYILQNGTFVSTKEGLSQDCPPSLGIALTQDLDESKTSFLLNLLQLEEAVKAFLPSPSSGTQHFREGIPGLMEQLRAGISSHEYNKHCSSSYTPCSVPVFVGGSGLCNG